MVTKKKNHLRFYDQNQIFPVVPIISLKSDMYMLRDWKL